MLNAKNERLKLATGEMDCVRFGRGERTLVLIPGLSDGLRTVRGMALPLALLYRSLAKDFTVYLFSRRVTLAPGMTTRDMAEDLNLAMDALGLTGTAVVGVSLGGMITQWLAVYHPERVSRLVLTVTLARPNPTAQAAVRGWLDMAKRGDYRGIMLDTAEKTYSPRHIRQRRLTARLMGDLGKPKSFDRFIIQAEACITHDAWEALDRIACPTLVIGGTDDRIVTGAASGEIAARVPGSRLYMYEGLGHGLYEEAPDYWRRMAEFCR